jgi:hypothetical protein
MTRWSRATFTMFVPDDGVSGHAVTTIPLDLAEIARDIAMVGRDLRLVAPNLGCNGDDRQ